MQSPATAATIGFALARTSWPLSQLGARHSLSLQVAGHRLARSNKQVPKSVRAVVRPGLFLTRLHITREKRVRNTMARYVTKKVVDQLLASGEDVLEGSALVATVLFADMRRFSLVSETMTPRNTVSMHNEFLP